MHCRQATQHRDEQLVIRLARPLKRELEGAAAEERRQSTAALVREILVEWAAARMTEKERRDGVISS
jgi:hypothetical protein